MSAATPLTAAFPDHRLANQHPQREPKPSPMIVWIHFEMGVLCTRLTTSSAVSGSISAAGVGSRALDIKPAIKKIEEPIKALTRVIRSVFITDVYLHKLEDLLHMRINTPCYPRFWIPLFGLMNCAFSRLVALGFLKMRSAVRCIADPYVILWSLLSTNSGFSLVRELCRPVT